jgi:large subunit ribosomal protein L6
MSRKGKLLIAVENNVEVALTDNVFHVKGPKGELTQSVPQGGISISRDDGFIKVENTSSSKDGGAYHGLYRTLLANMIEGVSKGFKVELELFGVGYRVQKQGNGLQLLLGYSHPVIVEPSEGISLNIEGTTGIIVEGIDKQAVGQTAAKIIKLRAAKKDPYKGKGVKYKGQVLRKKAGKRVK